MTTHERSDKLPALAEDSKVVAKQNLAACDLAGEAVILNMGTGLYHGLNDVGSRVWELVQSPARVAELRDALLAQYDVDAQTCLTDLLSVLEAMRTADLIEVCDDETGE